MRLIDADALEAKLEEQRKLYIEMDMKGAEHLLVHDVLHHVWEAPTIDAVPATIEGTLGYLHKVGWMQEHDRILTEDAEPARNGRWEDEFKEDAEAFVKHRYVCTACSNWQTYGKTAYCPNCGAKMDR